ncbi:putative membrane protein [Virgibacillus halotolerans]|uniref:hypothetical protein n=1 Tax=Virgibacillus halotolerans TaxID=1071053 RepID=UPI00195F76EA|nr:hypothetical protein [Virgibacillus halotolerans]MBM7600485.1 putative membrane protein [Virgibacillus halotolerans]
MKEEIYGQASQYIDAIASNLGVAAEHVYGMLVRQQVISGWVWMGVGLIVVIVCLALITFTIVANVKAKWDKSFWSRAPKNGYAKYLTYGDEVFSLVMVAVAVVLLVIFSIISVESALKVANPEYYAIKEIMDVIKGGK